MFLANQEATLAKAYALAKALQITQTKRAVIYLQGNLGSGKTTFMQGVMRALGFHHKVKSPTYTLVEPYELPDYQIYHFDLYRIQTAEELENIGIHDYFNDDALCFIEWPDKGENVIPHADLTCQFAVKEEGRTLQLQAHSDIGKRIVESFI